MDSWLPIAISTRADGVAAPVTFTEAVVKGLAEGGGLFVPEMLPKLSLESILSLAEIPYAKRAAFIYRSFGHRPCLTLRSTSSWMRLTATVSTMKRYAPLHRSMKTPMFSNCGMVPPALLRIWRCNAYPISLAQVHLSCANRESWKTPFLSWLPPRRHRQGCSRRIPRQRWRPDCGNVPRRRC